MFAVREKPPILPPRNSGDLAVLEQLKKIFAQGSQKSTIPDLPAIDLSQLAAASEDDPEAAELDALYRQALAAMEAVETGCESIADAEGLDDSAADSDGVAAETSSTRADDQPQAARQPMVTPQQILEAALFVGGTELTLKKLCKLLNNEFSSEQVESFITDLNERYAEESRPYEILFGAGGFRLGLCSEFGHVQNRVFGLGPKDVKLSQDALEVLSLIAYQQPISGDDVAELRGAPPNAVLRQLLRRELIGLDRSEDAPKQVHYHTTPRFLQAFGLTSLEDLPQAEDLAFK